MCEGVVRTYLGLVKCVDIVSLSTRHCHAITFATQLPFATHACQHCGRQQVKELPWLSSVHDTKFVTKFYPPVRRMPNLLVG